MCHWVHLGVQVEAGNDLMAYHSHTRPADLLLTNWTTGKTAAFDISVTSQLNTYTLMEAGVSAGSAALPTEGRAIDAKCGDWLIVCSPGSIDLWCVRKLLKPPFSWASRIATSDLRACVEERRAVLHDS